MNIGETERVREIATAIIFEALHTIVSIESRDTPRDRIEAVRWIFFGEPTDSGVTFDLCCGVLKLDVDAVRRGLNDHLGGLSDLLPHTRRGQFNRPIVSRIGDPEPYPIRYHGIDWKYGIGAKLLGSYAYVLSSRFIPPSPVKELKEISKEHLVSLCRRYETAIEPATVGFLGDTRA